ncbi:inosine-uridine preferring nucleoside hydrolase-like isoform X1 [Lithobates pipiens]
MLCFFYYNPSHFPCHLVLISGSSSGRRSQTTQLYNSHKMPKKLLLVDVDCGLDDAQALMMALAAPEVEILGITCCFGNTTAENVCRNVLRVLQVCKRMEISVVAVGPLTNLALAAKMDPTLPKKINKLYIMGGNMEGRGNRTVCAEFNFYLDPEAAYIVTNEFTCPIFIAALEFTWENSLTMEYFRNWVEQDTDKARFMKKITAKWQQKHGFVSYDSYAMAAAIDESIVTEYLECAVSVELHGRYARGMLVLDTEDKWKKQQKVVLMKKCNLEKFKERLWAALQ